MKQVIKVVSKYVKEGITYQDDTTKCAGVNITRLWSSTWKKLEPNLCGNHDRELEKIRKGQIPWRTFCNNI